MFNLLKIQIKILIQKIITFVVKNRIKSVIILFIFNLTLVTAYSYITVKGDINELKNMQQFIIEVSSLRTFIFVLFISIGIFKANLTKQNSFIAYIDIVNSTYNDLFDSRLRLRKYDNKLFLGMAINGFLAYNTYSTPLIISYTTISTFLIFFSFFIICLIGYLIISLEQLIFLIKYPSQDIYLQINKKLKEHTLYKTNKNKFFNYVILNNENIKYFHTSLATKLPWWKNTIFAFGIKYQKPIIKTCASCIKVGSALVPLSFFYFKAIDGFHKRTPIQNWLSLYAYGGPGFGSSEESLYSLARIVQENILELEISSFINSDTRYVDANKLMAAVLKHKGAKSPLFSTVYTGCSAFLSPENRAHYGKLVRLNHREFLLAYEAAVEHSINSSRGLPKIDQSDLLKDDLLLEDGLLNNETKPSANPFPDTGVNNTTSSSSSDEN